MSKKINDMNDNIKVEMVTTDQMTDDERKQILEREASIDAIPDLDILTGTVYEILTYLYQPKISKLLKTNESAVKMHLNNKYPDIPLGIITLLLEEDSREENIDRMLTMFESLRKAKSGNMSIEDAEKQLMDDVNERYVYSKYGSKEKFEQALAKEVKKEQRKKNVDNVSQIRNVGKINIKQ
jgi:hypothetical protein